MNKHTPGPWHYRRLDEWTHEVVTNHGKLPDGRPSDWAVASINKRREPEHEANALLIAAAPELLEALKALTTAQDLNTYGMALHNARAAIIKAEVK
jgi:hypothetical protein